MSPDIIILLLGLVALMALGIPICFAMMSVASVILLVFYGSGLLNVLNAAFVYQMQSESLLAIPMFALMAAFLQTSTNSSTSGLAVSMAVWLWPQWPPRQSSPL